MKPEKFPLTWPAGLPETENRIESNFKCTFAEARDGIWREINLLNVDEFIVSTNVQRDKKGALTGGKLLYPNPGVAVYFTYKGEERVIACDKWKYLHENLRAVEKSINAIRGLERWGCTDIINQALPNLKQIGQHAGSGRGAWWQVLEIPQDSTERDVRQAYALRAKLYHPDITNTGNTAKFAEIKKAYEEALRTFK